MTNKPNSKANNKENKRNDMRTPDGRAGKKKLPSSVEDFNGKPID